MAVSSVTLTLPTITGATVTERERQLEEYVNILLKELEYYLNDHVKVLNEIEEEIPTPTPPTPTPETNTITGSVVTFSDGEAGEALVSLTAKIVPVQSGSGDPSPTNICPISGFTEANVTRAGKNLMPQPYDISKPVGYPTQWKGTTIDGDWIVQTGYSSGIGGCGGVSVHNIKAGTYTISFDADLSEAVNNKMAVTIWLYYADNTNVQLPEYNITSTHYTRTITISQDAKTMSIRPTSNGKSTTAVVKYKNVQLEPGSTATSYEHYQGTTYPVSFSSAGTVYGGTLDPISGTLTVDKASIELGGLTWDYVLDPYVGFYVWRALAPSGIKSTESDIAFNGLCSTHPVISYSSLIGGSAGIALGPNGYIFVNDTNTPGGQLVYEVANRSVYTVTGAEATVLEGTNNIWADTGDVTVTYKVASES